jgi:hypothetical protein
MFAALGVRVTLIDMRPRLLEFVDAEIVESLVYHLRERRVTLRLGEEVSSIEVFSEGGFERVREGGFERVRTCLASGKQIVTDKALSSRGRNGATQRAESRRCGPRDRLARPAQDQRLVSDRGRAHLCGRRRDRLPQSRLDLEGAGKNRRVPCFPGPGRTCAGVVPLRNLHDSGNLILRRHRGGSNQS